MKLYYHKTSGGNVGDDLNAVLWPRLFPEMGAMSTGDWLVGIGTIVDGRLDGLPGRKIVMGSGYRPGFSPVKFRSEVYFGCVRGAGSAEKLGLDPSMAACDPGFLVSLWDDYRRTSQSGVGVIPHIYSETWTKIDREVREAGLKVISPTLAVPDFLRALAGCERVFCESLHGAIFADAIGVPWARIRISSHFYEGDGVSDFKWRDAFSVLGIIPEPVNSTTALPVKRSWPRMSRIVRPASKLFERRLSRWLGRESDNDRIFRLSKRDRLEERVQNLLERIDELRHEAVFAQVPRRAERKFAGDADTAALPN